MHRCLVFFPFAMGLLGAACGGEFSATSGEPVGGHVTGSGGASGSEQIAIPSTGGSSNGSAGTGNGSAGSPTGMGGAGLGGAGMGGAGLGGAGLGGAGVGGAGLGGRAGGGGAGLGGAGLGGAGLGGGLADSGIIDVSVPPLVDAALADQGTVLDAKADAGNIVTPDASDAAAPVCTPGAVQCDLARRCQNDGQWHGYTCGPLMLADVTGMDLTKFLGFNLGFRCKTITVCGIAQNCIYYGEMLGSMESMEAMFYDGAALADPAAVKISLNVGAASQCGNPPVTIAAGESFLVVSGSLMKRIFLPAFSGTSFTLYVREDGATFYDAALTQKAQGAG